MRVASWTLLLLGGCAWVTDDEACVAAGTCTGAAQADDSASPDTDTDIDAETDTDTDSETDTDSDGDTDTGCDEVPWYRDGDGDGFGDPSDSVEDCEAPSGYVADATDCDDSLGSTHPGAHDACDDGVDSDCDGSEDDSCGLVGTLGIDDAPGLRIEGDESGDKLAASVSGAGDLDGDGHPELVLANGNTDDARGRLWVVRGGAGLGDAADGPTADLDAVELRGTEPDAHLGSALAALGQDASADRSGFVASVWTEDDDSILYPSFLVFSDPLGDSLGVSDASARLEIHPNASRVTGDLRVVTGQLDSDAEPELMIGGYTISSTGFSYGRVWLVHDIPDDTVDLADADATVFSQDAGDHSRWTGSDVSLCDLDGDGIDSPIFGRAGPGASGEESGEVRVFAEGITAEQVYLGNSDWRLEDDGEAWSEVGRALACGDFDSSGHQDLVVRATASGKDMAVIVPGDTLSSTAEGNVDLRNFTRISDFGSPYFYEESLRFTVLPDATGDGTDELVLAWPGLAATEATGDDTGRVYLMTGPLPEGTPSVLDEHTAVVIGDDDGRRLGYDVAGSADVDGDGHGDLLVGAWADDVVDGGVGAAWLLFGGG